MPPRGGSDEGWIRDFVCDPSARRGAALELRKIRVVVDGSAEFERGPSPEFDRHGGGIRAPIRVVEAVLRGGPEAEAGIIRRLAEHKDGVAFEAATRFERLLAQALPNSAILVIGQSCQGCRPQEEASARRGRKRDGIEEDMARDAGPDFGHQAGPHDVGLPQAPHQIRLRVPPKASR